ncbi:hypothetical protein KAR91_74055 [Candidatus Pacearchaeota archaeon]|nr:hypothetical protein [Candidatus Pacearchaeota archaeon]
MAKYPIIPNGDGIEVNMDDEFLTFACCDCGMVHTFSFAVEDNGNLGIALNHEVRSTAAMRRHKVGNLHTNHPLWKLVRRE